MATTYSVAKAPDSVVNLAATQTGTAHNFTYAPIGVGNLIYLCGAWQASTISISVLSTPNITWFNAGTGVADTQASFPSGTWAFQQWIGIPSTTVSQTSTLTMSASTTAVQFDLMEFHANDVGLNPGNWFWIWAKASAAASTTVTFPNPGRSSNDGMYVGYAFNGAAPTYTNNTPAGFAYADDTSTNANGNFFGYNLTYGISSAVGAGTQTSQSWYAASITPYFYPNWVPATINAGSR